MATVSIHQGPRNRNNFAAPPAAILNLKKTCEKSFISAPSLFARLLNEPERNNNNASFLFSAIKMNFYLRSRVLLYLIERGLLFENNNVTCITTTMMKLLR